jgi:hypothetical protein
VSIRLRLHTHTGYRELGTVQTLEDATRIIRGLDLAYEQWERDGNPTLPEGDILLSYEGGDVMAFLENGQVWVYDDEWRQLR